MAPTGYPPLPHSNNNRSPIAVANPRTVVTALSPPEADHPLISIFYSNFLGLLALVVLAAIFCVSSLGHVRSPSLQSILHPRTVCLPVSRILSLRSLGEDTVEIKTFNFPEPSIPSLQRCSTVRTPIVSGRGAAMAYGLVYGNQNPTISKYWRNGRSSSSLRARAGVESLEPSVVSGFELKVWTPEEGDKLVAFSTTLLNRECLTPLKTPALHAL
eukprot:715824-Amorphochlora_amoeboformis.AAC.1